MRFRRELLELSPCEHGGKAGEIADRLGIEEGSLIDFSVSLNPYVPLDVAGAIRRACDTIFAYPDNRYVRFRESAARFVGVDADDIVPGNGSTEIIRLFAEAVIENGDIVAIPSPTFGEYEQQCRLFGAGIRHVRFSDITSGEYGRLEGCKAAFLCNPNNPDGLLLPRNEVERVVRYCRDNGILVVVDEAFIDLADPAQSVVQLVESYDNLLVMRSLTKCFAIPGLRLGFGVAGRDAAHILNMARLTWNLDSIAVEAGIYLMDNAGSCLEASRDFIKREREWLASRIGEIGGLRALPSSVNYFLVDVSGTGMTSGEFAEKMMRERIIVRNCSSFPLMDGQYIRVAVRNHEENMRLIDALSRVAGAGR